MGHGIAQCGRLTGSEKFRRVRSSYAPPIFDARAIRARWTTFVCRLPGTHLFHFTEFVNAIRGWGRGLRKAVGQWYVSHVRTPQEAFCMMAANVATALDIDRGDGARAEALRPVTWEE